MITDIVLLLFLGGVSAAFSYMLDYGLGKPGAKEIADISPKELLFGWSLFLAMRRLSKQEILSMCDDTMTLKECKLQIFITGREYFTWEYAFGMCIFCTGFWIAEIIAGIAFVFFDVNAIPAFFVFISTPSISHLILRKL